MASQSRKPSKLEASAHPLPEEDGADDSLEVIVKVRTPSYHPAAVTVRAQISPQIFTATVPRSELDALESDEEVVSVSVSRTLSNPG